MRALTGQGEQAVADLAHRYGVSTDAVRTLLAAVLAGNGTRAQFSHPELGGSGQWMAGGMTMVGDMFNHGLKATVSGLAAELSSLLASTQVYAPEPAHAGGRPGSVHPANLSTLANLSTWWPAELGQPSSVGGQNDSRYAVFPAVRRLAVQSGDGPVRTYDTLDHVIGGVQQQQGAAPGTLSFSSQHGTFTVDSLPPSSVPAPASDPVVSAPEPAPPAAASGTDPETILATIDRLSDLHQRGVLSDDEFTAKKTELLGRL
ncbi:MULTISPECIES: SHOCT domain-containing protein [Pseudofrankia]|uniref:SHOCT domain-containing protein n=1 Tax=Pseudofrankia TaxID=2994363 RepID=UPI000234BD13|nr:MULTISPECIES: SHOCT domain-containing protein [Pseudofrankia]OHV31353.1 hypothetical protein BCD49_32015 [Pseudofrankia sp. EUN1h]